jgi:hypothetical protein
MGKMPAGKQQVGEPPHALHLACSSAIQLLLAGTMVWAVQPLPAASVALTPVADTCVSEYWPTKNFGAMTFFNAGTTQNFTTNRGLIRFDVAAALPAGAIIFSASLTVEVVGQPAEPWNSADFGLHRLLHDWGEGDNNASEPRSAGAAGTNEANWLYRFAFTPEIWVTPGGALGVDYVASRSAAEYVYEAGMPYTFGPTPGLAADIQLWLDHPETNFGWMLIVRNETTDFTARRFGSREDPQNAPTLQIDYLVAPMIDQVERTGHQFNFAFTAFAGQTYVIEHRDALGTGGWNTSASAGPFAETMRVLFVDTPLAPRRFYRVVTY